MDTPNMYACVCGVCGGVWRCVECEVCGVCVCGVWVCVVYGTIRIAVDYARLSFNNSYHYI